MLDKNRPVDIKAEIKAIAAGLGIESEKADALAEKCYDDIVWRPYGGATSFAEIDQSERTREYSYKIDDETHKLRAIVENITLVEDLNTDQKATAMVTAANDYRTRVNAISPNEEVKSLWDKFVEFVSGKKATEVEVNLEVDITPVIGGFKAFKDKEGNNRWLSISSNAFEDLEKELFTTDALQEAVEYADKSGERGPLLIFHIPGAKVGQCDYQALAGRFLIESGTFDDTPLGQKMIEYFAETDEEHQVSIGYTYLDGDEEDGQYDWLRINERSICPFGTAANPWTDFKVIGETEMDPIKAEVLEKFLGKDLAAGVISAAEDKTKELEGNVRFKENTGDKKEEETAVEAAQAVVAEVVTPAVVVETPAEEKSADTKEAEVVIPTISGDQLVNLANILGDIAVQVTSLTETVGQVQAEVKELKESDDEKISRIMTPRGLPGGIYIRPTEDPATVLGDEVKSILEENGEQNVNPALKYLEDIKMAPARI